MSRTIQDRFHVTIMCPRCKTSPVHYLMALRTGGVSTGAPSPRSSKRDALRNRAEEHGPEAEAFRFDRDANGFMQPSKISGAAKWVQVTCQHCKETHQVKLETLRLAARRACRNQWSRLTFDDGGALVKFDDTWLR